MRTTLANVLALCTALLVGLLLPHRVVSVDRAHGHLKSFHSIARNVGIDKVTVHGYEMLYERNLAPFRSHPIRLLEIGLGCTMAYGPGKSWKVRPS
jgi:hypothetical protein